MSRPVVAFLAIAFTIPWLLWLVRLGTGIDVIAPGGMAGVGIATFVAVRRSRSTDTGLAIRPARTVAGYSVLGLGGTLGLAFLAVAIGAAARVHHLDLTGFSGLHQIYGAGPAGEVLLAALVRSSALFVVILPLAFCEEWGWRGFLLPRLLRFGTWPALLLGGLIWAAWHLPGYVGTPARPAFLAFVAFTVLFGVLLSWLRMRSGSVWPCTIAHTANNTLVIGFVNVAFTDASTLATPDPWSIGLSGWPGWLAMGAAVAGIAVAGRLRTRTAVAA